MLLSIVAFKSQLNNTFGKKMKEIGFSGSGFRYWMETEKFLFVFEIDVTEFRQFHIDFGIQPKVITQMGDFQKHNFKKIGAVDCELSKMLIYSLKKPIWNIAESKEKNEKAAEEMFSMIQQKAMPVVENYINKPDLFDDIRPADITDDEVLDTKLGGAAPAGLPTRTAWMLAMYYERTNADRAKAFARYGLKINRKPTVKITNKVKNMLEEGLLSGSVFGDNSEDDSFFGMEDLKRIAAVS